ncbi:MAG: preprotein translocase subunit YajC [Candidatus Coatesbacteria bacterium]|nr:MAG: preprotein translocase subunit YajC [Candidatus Coatesbacteria bacterium]RLC43472.1 MAG: preprotein translocase subunit YajC [Candidatus Coatesbacteria bacterium]RLC43947.1 MAG: preprotein translocase subunit YajC [Candidatus Coatesbacteria bacterium]
MFVSTAYAMSSGGGGGGGSMLDFLLPFIIIIAIFYLLIIMPQRRQAKKRQEMLEAMRKGDTVVTTGGIRGKVVGFSDSGKIVRIEIAKGVEVDVVRSRIDAVGKLPDAEQGK